MTACINLEASMSEYETETIKIATPKTDGNPLGYIVINKADFDASQHKEYVEPKAAKAGKAE